MTLEEHCADFILRHHKGDEWKEYRKRCLSLWEGHYGEDFAKRVRAIVEKNWKPTKGSKGNEQKP